ncbi:hypothetical protein GCM10010377_01430 [Streptomyces viridiviolaceus]|nr:hypothetical protein GCM10010377_01430 [Streptomyces viridiviolaceus]
MSEVSRRNSPQLWKDSGRLRSGAAAGHDQGSREGTGPGADDEDVALAVPSIGRRGRCPVNDIA